MRIHFIIILSLCHFFSQRAFTQTPSSASNKQEIALITSVKSFGKESSIDADFVQMLTGKAAIAAAKKSGEAEYDLNEKGDTSWYIPNDYYIRNTNTKNRKLTLTPKAGIFLIEKGSSKVSKSTLQVLKKNYKGKLFKLTFTGWTVTKIEELFIP